MVWYGRTSQRENDSRQIFWVKLQYCITLSDLLTRYRNAGYCFIEFSSPEAAAKALSLNGSIIPNTSRPFKLNWASGGGLTDRRQDPSFSRRNFWHILLILSKR